MGFEKLTEEEVMNYFKLTVYVLGESAGINTEQIINEAMDKMTKVKVRPKKGGYKIKATVQFDVSLAELISLREQVQQIQDLPENE